ncbi:hypothetical protein DFH11DRAFT_1646776 [Phellopilus nigrolimitatus]|nr:hypothetical protein DFH11DRAFT_1646776 [Phellopilus nigrolimitatus]
MEDPSTSPRSFLHILSAARRPGRCAPRLFFFFSLNIFRFLRGGRRACGRSGGRVRVGIYTYLFYFIGLLALGAGFPRSAIILRLSVFCVFCVFRLASFVSACHSSIRCLPRPHTHTACIK